MKLNKKAMEAQAALTNTRTAIMLKLFTSGETVDPVKLDESMSEAVKAFKTEFQSEPIWDATAMAYKVSQPLLSGVRVGKTPSNAESTYLSFSINGHGMQCWIGRDKAVTEIVRGKSVTKEPYALSNAELSEAFHALAETIANETDEITSVKAGEKREIA